MTDHTSDPDFDETLIAAMFQLAAEIGWASASPAAAASRAGLDHARARLQFPTRLCVLTSLNRLADQTALAGGVSDGDDVRAALFDLLMRRIDVLQRYRAGVLALLRGLPADPAAGLTLAGLSFRSMRWMLDRAGETTGGLTGPARVAAMVALWTNLVRVWQKDGSGDLSVTMAALDKMLGQAEKASHWLRVGKNHSRPDANVEQDMPGMAPEGGTVRSS